MTTERNARSKIKCVGDLGSSPENQKSPKKPWKTPKLSVSNTRSIQFDVNPGPEAFDGSQ